VRVGIVPGDAKNAA